MFNPAFLPDNGGSRTVYGAATATEVAELRKAMETGYGTDVATLTGAGALRIQSLEKTMLATVQENKHFTLGNILPATEATATVDEWTEQSGVGGFLGSSVSGEAGVIPTAQGTYARHVGTVKYLKTRREITYAAVLQNGLVAAEAIEAQNGAVQLLTDREALCFYGDSSVVPEEFDGIYKQVSDLGLSDHVIDAGGNSLASVNSIVDAAATVSRRGNFGTPTHLFLNPMVGADMDKNFDPAMRVALPGGMLAQRGTPLRGIVTAQGDVEVVRNVFIGDEADRQPFQVENSALAVTNDSFKPQAVTPTAGAGGADSLWGASHAGNYYYAVAGRNKNGQSTILVSSQVAVAAGQQVSIAITASVAATESGYAIYRGRKNGTNGVTDLRLMVSVPVTAGGTTTYIDKNRDLPGTSKAFLLNLLPGANAITWRQYLPMSKFQLYATTSDVVPWAQLLFGYLRLGKRRQHVVIKNIVTSNAAWKPFA